MPSSAMVWAMAGEMPEMMVLHPISTAAFVERSAHRKWEWIYHSPPRTMY